MAGKADVRFRVDFNRYPEISRRIHRQADAIVTRTALDLEGQMKVRAPVDTGFLRGSIQARRVGHAHWRVTVGADYGIYLEYGAAGRRAQPYFHPAIRVVRPAFRRSMQGILEAA